MEASFFKSAVPAQDFWLLSDSSLALPARPSSGSPAAAAAAAATTGSPPGLRVYRQVQLTLARRSRKKSGAHGNVWPLPP